MLVGGPRLNKEMLDSFAELCGGKDKPVLILPQCRQDPKDGLECKTTLSDAGFTNVQVNLATETSELATVALAKSLSKGAFVVIPNGDPSLFVKRFGQKWCQRIFPTMIQRGGAWLGMNSSASLVGDPLINGEKTEPGIGLIDAVVDFDYISGHHELRLRKAYFSCRVQLGIGLDPGDWLVLRDGVVEKKVGLPQVFLRE